MTDKLDRADWIAHGCSVLAKQGHQALKAQSLAKALGVSRGSFYWHFADIGDFEAAIIAAWQDTHTQGVIDRLGGDQPAATRLARLVRRAFTRDLPLERAMRSWSFSNARVARAVAAVDQRRTDYIATLLIELGLPEAAARSRALMLYWASLGRLMVAKPSLQKMAASDAATLVNMVVQPGR